MYEDGRREERKEERRIKAKAEKKERIPALELLMLLLGAVLVVALMFVVLDVNVTEIPKTLKVIWWSVVTLIVTGLASWGM